MESTFMVALLERGLNSTYHKLKKKTNGKWLTFMILLLDRGASHIQ